MMRGTERDWTRLAIWLASAAASGTALAQTAEGPPHQLPTVVVTGVAPDSPLTFVTDPTLPRQPVPASDGADYLKTIPGFTAIRNGGTNGDPVLRGMFGSRLNLITQEGFMPGACPGRMDNPLSYVSPETFDRLVVIKGPQTVQWGPGASAGSVRFERQPRGGSVEDQGLSLNAHALGGSFGRNDQMLDVSGGVSRGYARLTANRSDSDDYEDGAGEVVPSAWQKWNVDSALGWTPAEHTLAEISFGTGDGEARYAGRGMDGSQFERESLGLRFEKTHMAGALQSLKVSAFQNYADHVMDNYTLRSPNPMSMMPMPVAANVDRLTRGGRVALSWQLGAWELDTGLDTQRSRHRNRSAMGEDAYRNEPWVTDAQFANTGLFAEATWPLTTRRTLILGARADRARVTDERERTEGMMPMPNPTAGETQEQSLASGFARLEGRATEVPLSWYAGVGRVERMPDYWELFSADRGPLGSVNAFDAMRPERTTQLDWGLQYRGTRLDTWVSAYAGSIDQYILFSYRSGGMMGMMSQVTQIDARVRGAEAGLEYRPADPWKLGATLAYSRGENRDTGGALPQMPPLDARFTAAYEGARWSAGTLLRLVAKQDRVALDQGNVVGRDLGRSSGFAVLSMNATYRLSSHLDIAVGVDNLFDRNYSEHLNLSGSADFGYPADPVRIHEPGRTAWLKMLAKWSRD